MQTTLLYWVVFILNSHHPIFGAENDPGPGPQHDQVQPDFDAEFFGGSGNNDGSDLLTCANSTLYHPDSDLNIVQTIKKYGYDVEEHKVTTEDGYILTVYRIPGSPLSPKRAGKVPVYINHGLFGNAFSWIMLYGNGSLAYKLANAGYDVFLGNSRGNQFSDKHEWLSSDSDQYWDFSWNELGKYDIPAVIDHILNTTGSQDTYYIGHSMGTTQYMVAMSTRPDYGTKIRVGFLLAPAGYLSTGTNVGVRALLDTTVGPYHEYWRLVYGNSIDQEKMLHSLVGGSSSFCSDQLAKCGLCDSMVYTLMGYNAEQTNKSITNYFSKKYFDKGSTKIMAHFDQSIGRGTFNFYDYGDARNQDAYGSAYPPPYPLEKINAPTVVYFGSNDNIIPPRSQKTTLSKFSPGVLKEINRVQNSAWNHNDFLTATDLEKLVTNRVQWIMDNKLYVEKNKPIIVEKPGSLAPNPKIQRKYYPPASPLLLPIRVPLLQ